MPEQRTKTQIKTTTDNMPVARKRKRKSGRPRRDRYAERVQPCLELIGCWTRDGFTVEEICDKLKINPATFYRYRKNHPELEDALAVGRDLSDYRVENALFKRAVGYDIPVVEVTEKQVLADEDGNSAGNEGENGVAAVLERTVKRTAKHIPGSVQAQRIWLNNRRPDKWRDRQEIETNNTSQITVVTKMAMPDPPPDGV